MIRSAVTVSLVEEARGGPFVFWDEVAGACAQAQELGFDAIELFPPAPDAVNPGRLRILLNDHGLALAAVGTGAGWVKQRLTLTDPDVAVRIKARDFIRSMIDFAGQLRAPAIIGSMQGRAADPSQAPTALGYLADALEELGEHARQYEVPLLYEPLNRYETNLANTIEGGRKILRVLANQNVKLLADLFHMNIEESDIPEAIIAGGSLIGHVHLADSNRRAAGSGHIPFGPIADALHLIGYNGYASAEALPLPDPETAALITIQTFRQFFRRDISDTTLEMRIIQD